MGRALKGTLMRTADIPAFVDSVIATGCDIRAIGHRRYIIGDLDLGDEQWERAAPMLAEISRTFGDRDFLITEICQYLHSIGRGY